MKKALWAKIKVGSWVIYADEYEGVFRAKVVETDLRLYEPGEPSRWGYPYGKTLVSGVVKISYDSKELIENLENLIAYGPGKLARLRRDWNLYQTAKAKSDELNTTYVDRIREYRTY